MLMHVFLTSILICSLCFGLLISLVTSFFFRFFWLVSLVVADIWSLGCTVVELLTCKPPFAEYKNPLTAMYHIAMVGSVPTLPPMNKDGQTFLTACFNRDAKARATGKKHERSTMGEMGCEWFILTCVFSCCFLFPVPVPMYATHDSHRFAVALLHETFKRFGVNTSHHATTTTDSLGRCFDTLHTLHPFHPTETSFDVHSPCTSCHVFFVVVD